MVRDAVGSALVIALASLAGGMVTFLLVWATAYWIRHDAASKAAVCVVLALFVPVSALAALAYGRANDESPPVLVKRVAGAALLAALATTSIVVVTLVV